MRLLALVALGVLISGSHIRAQSTTDGGAPATSDMAPALTREADEKDWSFSASAYNYLVPDDRDYLQPTLTADCGWLHMEARYNYEDRDTASVWVGCNFSGGENWTFEVTPMLGAVLGNTDGIAPGYKASLAYWKMELSTEGEYVFDSGDSSGNFFYTWSELTFAPVEGFRLGLALQTTKLRRIDLDVQRGFMVAFEMRRFTWAAYLFDPDAHRPTVVLALSVGF